MLAATCTRTMGGKALAPAPGQHLQMLGLMKQPGSNAGIAVCRDEGWLQSDRQASICRSPGECSVRQADQRL